MTWFELYQQARAETQLLVPVARMDPVIALSWLTTAQFKVQQATNAVKRLTYITLDTNSTDGLYDLPGDLKSVVEINWRSTPDSNDYVGLSLIPYDALDSLIGSNRTNVNQANTAYSLNGLGQIYAAITPDRKLQIYPATNSGVLVIRYHPYLRAYSPSNKEEWGEYGADPTAAMSSFGPEPEMTSAEHGIKEYCKAMMYMSAPNGLQLYAGNIQLSMSEFREGIEFVKNNTIDYTHRVLPPPYMAGVF